MTTHRRVRPTRPVASLAAVAAGALALVLSVTVTASTGAPARVATGDGGPRPTIVLIHGAFADGSSWNGVIRRLQRDGFPVIAPANPLRDLAGDSAYIESVLATIDGPVVLVGHSYGGAVITNAGAHAPNVKALVYVAGFALDQGESLASISAQFPNNEVGPATVARPFPQPDGSTGTDLYLAVDQFREVFAADVPARTTDLMAVTQRPLALAAVLGTSADAAWRNLPTWYLVSKQDHTIDPEAERFMAQRANATTIEVNASHAVAVSRPGKVADLIETAAASTG